MLKIKNLWLIKEIINKLKREVIDWGMIFVMYIINKELI